MGGESDATGCDSGNFALVQVDVLGGASVVDLSDRVLNPIIGMKTLTLEG